MDKQQQLIAGIRDLYNQMVFLNKRRMEESLRGTPPTEVHCIEYIAQNADANVTRMAQAFYMTRGALSKLTKKLLQKGLVESYRRPDNKKELYFRLTERGQAVYQTHERLHSEFRERDKAVFEQVTAQQLDTMLSFVQRYRSHLDAEIKKQGLEIADQDDCEE